MIEETRYKETVTAGVDVDRPRMAVGVAPAYEREYADYRPAVSRLVGWGPIWAGVVSAVGVQVILALLGTAIGLSVIQAREGDVPQALDMAAGIWWVLSALVALFIGGWVAGLLAAPRSMKHGALHGFFLWCTVTALSAALLATTGGVLLGGGLGVMSGAIQNRNQPVITSNERSDQSGQAQFRADAEQFAESSAGIAWWTFAVLVLSAGAAVVGGAVGHRTDHRQVI